MQRASLPERRATAWHELGEVYTREKEHDLAFEAHAEAGRERAKTPQAQRVARANWRAHADMVRALPDTLLGGKPSASSQRPRPAFLIGFPRSGTTMLEQVLAAHPEIVTTDERRFLFLIRDRYERRFPMGATLAEKLAAIDAPTRERLRADYFAAVAAALPAATRALVLVDKLPLNLVDLPWIRAIFPDARVLVALRDPRDACLSCCMQDFVLNEGMIELLTLEGAARFYADVMSIWLGLRDRIGLSWLEVRYEDTVQDLEAAARRVLAFLAVSWDERVL